MSLTVSRSAGVYKPTKQPSVKVGGVWKDAKKVFIKDGGVWHEGWPLIPNPPTNVKMTMPVVGDNVTVSGTWAAPVAGAAPADKYQVRVIFTHPTTGIDLDTYGWVDRTLAQLSYTTDRGGLGWQVYQGYKARIEVVSVINATPFQYEQRSTIASSAAVTTPGAPVTQPPPPPVVVPPLPAPAAPTAFDVNISECELTQTWAHVGGNALDKFEIQTWISGGAVTTYTVGETLRKWTTYPWNAATIGRCTINTQIRAVGAGGASVWVKISGVMPGPVSMSNYGYSGGVSGSSLFCTVDNIDEGVGVYSQKYGANPVLQTNAAGNTGKVTYGYTNSFSHPRDNVTKYRLGFLPRVAAAGPSQGWTGRPQWTGWAIKIANPVFIRSVDCNTWWSIPIPGKWRTNPQADDWFYQGKSISGNSYGCLFYLDTVKSYFDPARIGYSVAITSWDVYTKRTYTGGLVAAVALNTWTHSTKDDSVNAAPTLVDGPLVGPSLARNQQVWLALPVTWAAGFLAGTKEGIAYYVPPGQADNQLRSEIGNVSNRYMILDKPQYGTFLDGQPPGTLRFYHDA